MKKTYCIDIDGVICNTVGNDYPNSKPNVLNIAVINCLFDEGNTIKVFTGRGSKSGLDWCELTVKQLAEWGVKYHELLMDKPPTDFIVDDKSVSIQSLLNRNALETISGIVSLACLADRKILICGNGGLAAEAEHFAAELMGLFAVNVFVPCIALTSNTSLITALANDLGFEKVFSHQIDVLGRSGDVLIAMTTSNSRNIALAVDVAQQRGLTVVVLGGRKTSLNNADYKHTFWSETVDTTQNEIIIFLHQLARLAKEKVRNGYSDSKS